MTLPAVAVSDPAQSILIDGREVEIETLSWWRRPRHLRRQLVGTLLFIAFLSVALVGILNFVAGRRLLDEGTREQLVGVGEARARSIELGIDRVLGQVSVAASDLAVADALEELADGFEALEAVGLADEELAELIAAYEESVVRPIEDAGLGTVSVDEVMPRSNAGRYVQYHYVAQTDRDERREVDDPGDGSDYSEVHARVHAQLVALTESLGVEELLLVSSRTSDIVYSVQKRIDFGANLSTGPYRDSELADAVLRRLSGVRIGESVIADQGIYIPGGGRPVAFVAASIRRGTEVIGALVVQIPVEAINSITTADGRWEEVGLGGGESYLVGADRLLRSESRLWIEDPDRYLDKVDDDELVGLIEVFGSPVGLQPVETDPVDAALEGRTFDGTTRNYLGARTFAYSTPIEAPGVDWVVVADVPLDDARAPLLEFAKRLGLVLVIILPAAGLIGVLMASRMTRSIPPVVEAAHQITAGERNPDLPDLGRDEFGDLARRLGEMANQLGQRETELAEEYESTRRMLLTVLPPRILDDGGVGVGTGELAAVATAVAVGVDSPKGESDTDDEVVALLAQLVETAEAEAEDRGIERVRSAADWSLFLVGLHEDDDGAARAIDFADALRASAAALAAAEDASVTLHIGISTGPVATGVLDRGRLTFGAWGEPVRRALAIAALSSSDEVLVDDSTAAGADVDHSSLEPADGVVGLDGEPMEVFSLAARPD